MTLPVRLSPWSGGGFAFFLGRGGILDGASALLALATRPPRAARRVLRDELGWRRACLGLARVFEAAALSLPALVAALGVLAGLAGVEGFDLAGWEVVDDERLGGMAPKSFLLCEHREQSSS